MAKIGNNPEPDCGWKRDMGKYTEDKERMDEIADKLSGRQDIWQDRFIYWIAVAIGHILEWMRKHDDKERV